MIYSIGYGGPKNGTSIEQLETVLTKLRATLVDVRAKPFSRWRTDFGRAALEKRLGDRYQWHGDLLGGPGGGGKVTKPGLDMLRAQHDAGRNLVLMCQEHAPAECHRHFDIALALLPKIDVVHIFDGEMIQASELQRSIDAEDDYDIYDDSPLAAG